MSSRIVAILTNIGALGIMLGALLLISQPNLITKNFTVINQPQEMIIEEQVTAAIVASSSPIVEPVVNKTAKDKDIIAISAETSESPTITKPEEDGAGIQRISNPYNYPPEDENILNQEARAALVNIICETSGTSLKSISGSGTIIDPRGIIITNAHIAQYILLSRNSDIKIACRIREGSPAKDAWIPDVIFFPSSWITAHAKDILEKRPVGTGEHDYALIQIVASTNGSALPATFPYLKPDTRETIGFTGDSVLIAAYPAEFGGSSAAINTLYASSVFTNIKQMLTFTEQLVDMISLGGTALAQSGSSGGAVVNMWGRVIGIVATTSEGETTETRDLRAITMAHIDRSIRDHTGTSLEDMLARDLTTLVSAFKPQAETLANILIAEIEEH